MELESVLFSRAETAKLVAPSLADTSHSKHNGKWKPWVRWFFSDSWALEYVAMTTAIAALAAIAIILGVYNGRPLDDWPHAIQLNTVLSTLATIMKGFLLMPVCACLSQLKWLWYTRQAKPLRDFQLFDVASRGPWGAMQLLFRLRFWHMASIGSLVTLLSLASGAFVQQSVSYPLRTESQGENTASVPYAQYFESYNIRSDGVASASPPLMAAIYDGVSSKNLTRSTSFITPYCSTGNCTFPSYASLGVCSNCHNVTSSLQFTTEPRYPYDTIYSYTLPNGHSLISEGSMVAHLNISVSSHFSSYTEHPLELNSNALSAYQSAGTIMNVSVVTGVNPSLPWTQTAWDCVLSFCAKSYGASESLGYFDEKPLKIFDELKSTIQPVGDFEYNETIAFNVPSTHFTSIGNRNRTFSVYARALLGLQNSLAETLPGLSKQDVGAQVDFTSSIAQGFYHNGVENVVRTVTNIADALTNAMRMSSGHYVQGSAFVMKAHIHVRWWWLILPLVMVILGVMFLGLTVRQTQRSGVPNWRSSALAIMEHGTSTHVREGSGSDWLTGSDDDRVTTVGEEKVSDLEVWAEGVSVRLRKSDLWGKGYGLTFT